MSVRGWIALIGIILCQIGMWGGIFVIWVVL